MDVGAFETAGVVPPSPPAGPPATPVNTPPVLTLGKARESFVRKGRKGKEFRPTTSTRSPSLPVTLSEEATLTLRLERLAQVRPRSGKCTGTGVFKRGKRCYRYRGVTGARSLAVPAGQSLITWGGGFNGKLLSGAEYRLTATPVDLAGLAGEPKTAKLKLR